MFQKTAFSTKEGAIDEFLKIFKKKSGMDWTKKDKVQPPWLGNYKYKIVD